MDTGAGRQEQARQARIDEWLAAGGTVLAATDRAARSVAASFHAARRAEGCMAWPTPSILAWDSWVQQRWLERNDAGLMLLNPLQEQALWSRVIGRSRAGEGLLHPGRLADAAQQAYRLLCGYAPHARKPSTRTGWSGDAAVFSEWVDEFESDCRRQGLVSNSRLVLELTEEWQNESTPFTGKTQRPPLLLAGFDRLLETQEELLHAWGDWRQEEAGETAQSTRFLAAIDAETEVEACVNWVRARLKRHAEARCMVITTALRERRGELERALLEASQDGDLNLDFEFSLGIPLGQVSLARSAILLLRWLFEPLSEPELDWLLSCGHCAVAAEEEMALAETMREVRRRSQERPEWGLDDFAAAERSRDLAFGWQSRHAAWSSRLLAARNRLAKMPSRQSPLDWVGEVWPLLEAIGWPGFRPLSSAAFQARQRWERVLEECGSLGFDGSQPRWRDFVSTVAEAVSATIFAAESTGARVQITEPLESAGQLAGGIWFLGADDENWPSRGRPHPLLPAGLQRESGMPHATTQSDWKLAQTATLRLLTSADEVVFSYARSSAEAEARPSRLVLQHLGAAQDQAEGRAAPPRDLTEKFEDRSLVRYPNEEIEGGAATLTYQSICPFQAFARSRLNAEDWERAEAGLTPKQRGQLLHAVLYRIWASPAGDDPARGGLSGLAELQSIAEVDRIVREAVGAVMAESFDPQRRNSLPRRYPRRYLELEAGRLTQLVTEWLEYERERLPFTVTKTEVKREVAIAGLKLKLRPDRVDELPGGGRLIIDYKSSEVGPNAWYGERPDDVQLPLYATFAVPEYLEGLVFARVRPGQVKFCGRVRDAAASLRQDLSGRDALVSNPLTDLQLLEWRERIERLGEDFLAGRAEVNPKDPVKTCERCHLHAVCRIYENPSAATVLEDEEEDADESDGGNDA